MKILDILIIDVKKENYENSWYFDSDGNFTDNKDKINNNNPDEKNEEDEENEN